MQRPRATLYRQVVTLRYLLAQYGHSTSFRSDSRNVFIFAADSLEAFGNICQQLLQDVQERLVFRAHLYLQSDILNYKPSPGDLAYPDKLEMMEVLIYHYFKNPFHC